MAEGLFRPTELEMPGISPDALCAAMVRILPKTTLVLGIAASAEEARGKDRNEAQPDGSECWYRFFTEREVASVDDPEFAMGMVRHEFATAVKSGATFPVTVPLDGGGTGFAISAGGDVMTNYHLAIGEIGHQRREGGVVDQPVLCGSLRAQVARRRGDGAWEWRDAGDVWLVSNPPATRALEPDASGVLHPREDTALLRVAPPPEAHLRLSERIARPGEPVWMAGFPLRTARALRSRQERRYDDADGTLRVSTGHVTDVAGADYFTTDLDGSMGNSGSPVFDASGGVIGMFSRATGQGPRNAFEYGHVLRVHVSTALAVRGLALRRVAGVGG